MLPASIQCKKISIAWKINLGNFVSLPFRNNPCLLFTEQNILPNQTHINDYELLALLRSGDPRGAELLWDCHASVLYGLIFRIVQMDETAENLLLETIREIQNQIGQYDSRNGHLINWMIEIAHRLSVEKLKSRDYQLSKRSNKFENSGATASVTEAGYHPESSEIKNIVRRLEPEQRQVIDLLYLDGMSVKDAALKLNMPVDALRSKVRVAVQKLRQYFEILRF